MLKSKSRLNILAQMWIIFCLPFLVGCPGKISGVVNSLVPSIFQSSLYISPTALFMTVGQSKKLEVKNGQEPFQFSILLGQGQLSQQGEFLATLKGTSVIKVEDSTGASAYATIEVSDSPVIRTQTQVMAGTIATIAVENGRGPFQYAIETGGGYIDPDKGEFIAPQLAGTTKIKVTDANGSVVFADIVIKPILTMAQTSVTLNAGTSINLSASGGVGAVYYEVVGAGGTIDSVTGEFTASGSQGITVVKATDSAGNVSYTLVTVGTGSTSTNLVVEPSAVIIGLGQIQKFSVVEGKAPFTFQLVSGLGSVDSQSMEYRASSSTTGTATIRITDSLGASKDISITVTNSLAAVTGTGGNQIVPGGTLQITPSGGAASGAIDYAFTAERGTITNTGLYTAPNASGTDVITVTDKNGFSERLYISVTESLRLAPSEAYLVKSAIIQFLPVGGVAPFEFSIVEGGGDLDSETGLYKTPSQPGANTISVKDSSGNIAQSRITIYENLTVDPFYKVIMAGQSFDFTIEGGIQPFNVTLTTENSGALTKLNENQYRYTAPANVTQKQNQSIKIQDQQSNEVMVNVVISPVLSLTAETLNITNIQSTMLTASGGVGPYNFSIDDLTVADIVQLSSNRLELKAKQVGSVKVTVKDSNQIEASVDIVISKDYSTPPTAQVNGLPQGVNSTTQLDITVSGIEVVTYKYKVGVAASVDCTISSGYSAERTVANKITDNIGALPDGELKICVIGKNAGETWQLLLLASQGLWSKDTSSPMPSALRLITPSTSPHASTTLTIAVDGLEIGATAYIYSDANCSAAVGSVAATASNTSAELQVANLNQGATYTYYAKQTDVLGNTSSCSTANVSYHVLEAPPTSLSYPAQVVNLGQGFSANPAIGGGTPTAYSAVGLPTGVSIHPTTGVISGSPSDIINPAQNFTITASNEGGSVQGQISIRVLPDMPLLVSSSLVPSDNSALLTIYVKPMDEAGTLFGPGKTVEVSVDNANITLVGGTACRTVAATCAKMVDTADGFYFIQARSATAGAVANFSFVVGGTPDTALVKTASATFDSTLFTTISANTTITNAAHGGKNLYFTGGTATFDPTTQGQNFGVLFLNGGTVTHTASTTTTIYRLSPVAQSLVIQSGSISVIGKGYPGNYSYGPNGPSTSLYVTQAGSHGGMGSTGAAVFDDYRDPNFPGGAGEAGFGMVGGGVVKISSTGMCTILNGGTINSDGPTNGTAGSAGGTINLKCASFGGTLAASSITSRGTGTGAGASGGGRVALISSGGSHSFAGNLNFMSNPATFKGRFKIHGASTGAGAGTLFVKHSGLNYGALIVDNNGVTGGVTPLVAMEGTITSINGSNLGVSFSSLPALSAPYGNVYSGLKFRPNLSFTNGTSDNWLDDAILGVQSNDGTSINTSSLPPGDLVVGSQFRSIDILDYLDVGGNAQISTYGDLVVLNGSLSTPTPDSVILNNGTLAFKGGASSQYPVTTVLSSGTYDVTTLNVDNLTVSGATLTAEVINASGNVSLTAGTINHPVSTSTVIKRLTMNIGGNLTISGGSINVVGRGYPGYYSYGPTGPSTSLYTAQSASHGGMGSMGGAVFDDYRDPIYPGGGGEAGNGMTGGGVVLVNAQGTCTVNNGGAINADAPTNGGAGSAGGTINMKCGGFAGTMGTAAITARGTGSDANKASGGGRIAFISSGDASSFTGNFNFLGSPATFKNSVRVNAAAAGGGAGTIFAKHSGLQYGALIIDNNGITGGKTPLISMEGTVSSVSDKTLTINVTSNPALSAAYTNLYKNMKFRPDLSFDNGTSNDWLDDNILTVESNNASSITTTTQPGTIGVGATFRSIDIVDYLEISGNAWLQTNGDLVVLNGALSNPSATALTLTNGTLDFNSVNADLNVPIDTVLSSGTYTPTILNTRNLTISGATLSVQTANVSGNLLLSSGTLTHPASTTTEVRRLEVNVAGSLTVSGGTISAVGRGYPGDYSWGPTGPSTALYIASAGSHGGRGATGASIFDDYRDPNFPGSGGASGFGMTGGGVIKLNVTGTCTVNSGGTINADAPTNGSAGAAGGTINMKCGGFAGTAGTNSITVRGTGSGGMASGGGRIALISTGGASSFSGNFDYKNNLATFKSRVRAHGSASGAGAGTIFIKNSDLVHGILVVDNNGYTGTTPMHDAAANSQVVYSNLSAQSLQMTASGTPYANKSNMFINHILDIFPTGFPSMQDPQHASRIRNTITQNGANTLVADAANYSTIAADHEFRMTYLFDQIEISGGATVNFGTADVVINPGVGNACDLHSTADKFDIPTGASIIGNSIGSSTCSDSLVTTKGTTVNFTSYFLVP